ncbi:hypothetical protein ACIRCZ_10155 [Leifsonia sp. NPDC102414]|uniref:hypothetical protein n=1 Tax=Leifsonia sp. NPDC102414 TaxID=3364124 RepID=UPI0038073155
MIGGASTTRNGLARMSVAAALVTVPVVAIVWSLLVWWPTLPAELPAQWSGDEVASRLPTFFFAGTAVVIAGVAAAFGWHAALRPRSYERHRRVLLISGSVAAITAAAWLISASVVRNPDQEIGAAGLLAIAALFYGLVPFALARASAPSGQAEAAEEPDEFAVMPSEILAWSRTQVVPTFAWACGICVLAAIVFGYVPLILAGAEASNLSVVIVMSLLALTFYAGARIRVTVDLRGLRALSATVGIRLVSVRLAEAASARVTTLEPLRWGGWGYRVGLRGKALVLRGGPAIVVTLHSGAVVAVTTPDAEQAVGVLRALQRRNAA